MSNSSTEGSLAEGIDALDIPLEAHENVRDLCHAVFDDDCGRLENVRLAWEVPPPEAGQKADRDGWRVYECDVVGYRFAVPHGAPIPVILADHYNSEGEPESILYRYVHPDLIENREVLVGRLLQYIRNEIEESLASLSTSLNLLEALREMEELPFGASPHPYRPMSENKRVGYEPADEERPVEEDSPDE